MRRIYDHIKKRKYEIAVLKTQMKERNEFRMFVVERRDAKTLVPIIKRNALEGSDIHSDEWRAYNKLKLHGYVHYTVNHKKNFVNPDTGKHTQLVECLWGLNKKRIPNRIRGKSCDLLQPYLAEQWWKSVNGTYGPDLFEKIIKILNEKSFNEVNNQIENLKYF